MKSKALISVAVASALACSAAYAGGNKHSAWIAPSDQQPSEMTFTVDIQQPQVLASMSIDEENVGATFSSGEGLISSEDALASSDDSLSLADDGIYVDYMMVSFTPVDSWDLYLVDVDPTSDSSLALLDSDSIFVSFAPVEYDYYVFDQSTLDSTAMADFMIAPSDLLVLHTSWDPGVAADELG